MNDTIRGGLALALVGLVVIGLGSAVNAETISDLGVLAVGVGVLTLAWGLVQGMTPKKDDET